MAHGTVSGDAGRRDEVSIEPVGEELRVVIARLEWRKRGSLRPGFHREGRVAPVAADAALVARVSISGPDDLEVEVGGERVAIEDALRDPSQRRAQVAS